MSPIDLLLWVRLHLFSRWRRIRKFNGVASCYSDARTLITVRRIPFLLSLLFGGKENLAIRNCVNEKLALLMSGSIREDGVSTISLT
jgi:hypothetical protein